MISRQRREIGDVPFLLPDEGVARAINHESASHRIDQRKREIIRAHNELADQRCVVTGCADHIAHMRVAHAACRSGQMTKDHVKWMPTLANPHDEHLLYAGLRTDRENCDLTGLEFSFRNFSAEPFNFYCRSFAFVADRTEAYHCSLRFRAGACAS